MSHGQDDRSPSLPKGKELSPGELAEFVVQDVPFQILDVRAPERVSGGRPGGMASERYHNVRGSEVLKIDDAGRLGLDPDLPVAVVCGRGLDSRVVAAHLGRLGLQARSLAGGMAEWTRLVIPTELDPPQGLDRIVQFDRIGPGCLGYLLISGGDAFLVDPPLHAHAYLEILESSGATLVGVADTHAHADYVSGGPDLARRFGVPYYLHPEDLVFPYDGTPGKIGAEPLEDGQTLSLGNTALAVMHTPGHTRGSVTFLLEDRLALTGDFIFVESVGRPDLAGKEEEWGKDLWDSMARAIREWGDGMAVYPGHYQAETERRLGRAVGCSFGELLRENQVLRLQDPDVFLHLIMKRKAPAPEAYRKITALNLGLIPVEVSKVEELEVGRNLCALSEGGQLLP